MLFHFIFVTNPTFDFNSALSQHFASTLFQSNSENNAPYLLCELITAIMEVDDFMRGKKPLVKRHVLKSEIRRVDYHELPEPEIEASDDSTITGSHRDETGFMNDFDEDMEDRTVKQIIALGCDGSVSKKVVTDTLDRIERLGKHPDQPGRTARVEIL